MVTNCFRFAPRDSVPGLIAKICRYLKDHPGWSEEEIEEQIKQFIRQTGVESFNGRTGDVVLNEDDVNNLKIASAYFAEGDETIDELDIADLYNHGVRFVFTNWNAVISGYDSAFVLEYFSGSNDVVYYPMVTGSGGGNIVSVNGKTGIVELALSDILGDSGAQVKLCTATEFTSNTIATWNAYYKNGYRLVCVVNDESTAVDFMYVLKQDVNNHQPIMISSGLVESVVTSVNTMSGDVQIPVVDVAEGDSDDAFAKIFINENEDYPVVPSYDSERLGGQLPSYYATSERVSQLSQHKANKAGWTADKFLGTDASGNMVVKDALLTAYPVGSIYMSANETSPAELFGGTWEQIKGRFLIGTGTPENNDDGTSPGNYNMSLGSKGGEKDHKLTVEELAAHDHRMDMINKTADAASPNFVFNYQYTSETPLGGDTRAEGGDKPHNNMPPYLAVNMWKRVS